MSLNRIVTDIVISLYPHPYEKNNYAVKEVMSEEKFSCSTENFRYVIEYTGKKCNKYVYIIEEYVRRSFVFSDNPYHATKYKKVRGKLNVVPQGV